MFAMIRDVDRIAVRSLNSFGGHFLQFFDKSRSMYDLNTSDGSIDSRIKIILFAN